MNYVFPGNMSLKALMDRKGVGKHDLSIGSMSPSTTIIVGHTRYHKELMRKKERIQFLTFGSL